MLAALGNHLREYLRSFPSEDQILFNSSTIVCNPSYFTPLLACTESKTIAFVDGGYAELIAAGNFCISFIRVGAIMFRGGTKLKSSTQEFYLFTKARYDADDLRYESTIFPMNGPKMIDEKDLTISSTDSSIRIGMQRAPVTAVGGTARRFAELQLASSLEADYVLMDGTLEPTLKNEEKYLVRLPQNVSALAKTCSLFTTSGNNPMVLLNKLGGPGCWSYHLENKTYFVKLHEKAKHVFRFEGDAQVLAHLVPNSRDALFLGYPYGLQLADQLARVSNEERNSLRMNFLLRKENKEILDYLNATNAHEILDGLG